MILVPQILLISFAYLLGSIPFGYIFTRKFTGKNILESGSGNIGSTNVGRIAGKKISVVTQVCDMLKGLLPVLSVWILQKKEFFQFEEYFICLVALAAIVGHDFSVFLRLKGGRGVNTTLGASLLIAPFSVFFSVLIYFAVKWKYRFVSLGSIGLAISLPISDLVIHKISFQFYYLLAASALIVLMHIPNIRRLLKGNENRSQ
jgi:acyl phosphate:glycerol-3-phosphate acyltransferase